jgi:uncharacterized membrane protein YkoI
MPEWVTLPIPSAATRNCIFPRLMVLAVLIVENDGHPNSHPCRCVAAEPHPVRDRDVRLWFRRRDRSAVVDIQEATRIVHTQFPNARIMEIELHNEDGKLVYEVERRMYQGEKKEAQVNSLSGKSENDY